MDVLFDRNVEPKYRNAIASIPGVSTEHVDDYLPQDADDSDITDLAKREEWIVFTRDDHFFQHTRDREVGLLYFPKKHDTLPREIATSVERIKDTYQPPYSQIEEGVPGQWLTD